MINVRTLPGRIRDARRKETINCQAKCIDKCKIIEYTMNTLWGSKGFDRVLEVGEASRRMMRQISN